MYSVSICRVGKWCSFDRKGCVLNTGFAEKVVSLCRLVEGKSGISLEEVEGILMVRGHDPGGGHSGGVCLDNVRSPGLAQI